MTARALIIAPQPFFSPRGTPFSVYYRTLATAEFGVKIDLLTYGEGEDPDIPGVNIIRIPRFKILGNVKIGPSFLKLFLDFFIVIWAFMLLFTRRYDFVHAHEEAVFFCRFFKGLFRFKLIYDMHSSLPQQLTNFNFTRSELLITLFRKLEDTCLKSADAVITICPDLSDYVDGVIDKPEKHVMIENSIFDHVKLKSSAPGVNSLPDMENLPGNKRFIVYAGTLESYQGIELLIDSFKKVHDKINDAFLIVVGGSDPQVAFYSDYAQKRGVADSALFTGRVPQELAKRYCALAHVIVSPRIAGTNTPLKIYELLAGGIPLVATDIYSHTQVLDGEISFLATPEPGDMADKIMEAIVPDGPGRTKAMNAVRVYEKKYSRPVYIEKMRKILGIIACAE
ncbi:MAG: glycosyltransferase family 4 protein [Desulfobacteraceae bacterium]|nr:glycosyltransferase family 4 protein [Desulfobacteraceae bacterium]